jgi:hypothetical protein
VPRSCTAASGSRATLCAALRELSGLSSGVGALGERLRALRKRNKDFNDQHRGTRENPVLRDLWLALADAPPSAQFATDLAKALLMRIVIYPETIVFRPEFTQSPPQIPQARCDRAAASSDVGPAHVRRGGSVVRSVRGIRPSEPIIPVLAPPLDVLTLGAKHVFSAIEHHDTSRRPHDAGRLDQGASKVLGVVQRCVEHDHVEAAVLHRDRLERRYHALRRAGRSTRRSNASKLRARTAHGARAEVLTPRVGGGG